MPPSRHRQRRASVLAAAVAGLALAVPSNAAALEASTPACEAARDACVSECREAGQRFSTTNAREVLVSLTQTQPAASTPCAHSLVPCRLDLESDDKAALLTGSAMVQAGDYAIDLSLDARSSMVDSSFVCATLDGAGTFRATCDCALNIVDPVSLATLGSLTETLEFDAQLVGGAHGVDHAAFPIDDAKEADYVDTPPSRVALHFRSSAVTVFMWDGTEAAEALPPSPSTEPLSLSVWDSVWNGASEFELLSMAEDLRNTRMSLWGASDVAAPAAAVDRELRNAARRYDAAEAETAENTFASAASSMVEVGTTGMVATVASQSWPRRAYRAALPVIEEDASEFALSIEREASKVDIAELAFRIGCLAISAIFAVLAYAEACHLSEMYRTWQRRRARGVVSADGYSPLAGDGKDGDGGASAPLFDAVDASTTDSHLELSRTGEPYAEASCQPAFVSFLLDSEYDSASSSESDSDSESDTDSDGEPARRTPQPPLLSSSDESEVTGARRGWRIAAHSSKGWPPGLVSDDDDDSAYYRKQSAISVSAASVPLSVPLLATAQKYTVNPLCSLAPTSKGPASAMENVAIRDKPDTLLHPSLS